jgi:hypothetical protein
MGASQDQREAIAALIRPIAPDGWSVFASPPASEPVPAIVVGPGSPYLERVTFGHNDHNYQLTLIQGVAAGAVALDVMDAVLDELLPALSTVKELRWKTVETAGNLTTRGGKDVVVATIPVSI